VQKTERGREWCGAISDPALCYTNRAMQRAVFLDLNGTLVLPVQAETPNDFTLIPGADQAVRLLTETGFLCPVVTVQSRIEKGIYSDADFRAWFATFQETMAQSGALLVGPYICPHRPQSACACAKPNPLLYQQTIAEHNIDPSLSYVVGDTSGDVRAAPAIGAVGCLVRTGWGPAPGDPLETEAAFVGVDLREVAQWIVRQPFPVL
jgi:D-glycero-D-manno-heptose 1,7-bisphosphate phosphatase